MSDFMDHRVEDSFDIGFRFGETVQENMVARPIGQPLRDVKLALAASPGYVREFGKPESIEDLHLHLFLKFRAPTSRQILPVRLHTSSDPMSEIVTLQDLKIGLVTNNTDVMMDMAVNGAGICYLMDAMLEQKLNSGDLLPILKEHWCDLPNVYMYYAPENKQNLRVRCFLDFINKKIQ